jgi:S1-C subfamily serine protease
LPKDQPLDRVPLLGLDRIQTCSPVVNAAAGVPYQPGVLIESIVPGSRLAQLAEPGTMIVAVDDVPVRSVEEFYAALRMRNLLRGARVALLRPDGQLTPFLLRVE